ncbi:MAG TPA: acetyl-CoA carboxylase biotin carboxylase subunit [Dictyobacter sp.]|jgi:3-methylcrotonyl-CoA carboxylase alpha subunit|nr:acetyl-CoA carboxylase biotin carboxylase subunit [Dictyobacter sp.]
MFKKILIANRGEIAVRIMATCREMGIRTIAIYSEADQTAFHVRAADEAYSVGSAPASQSYLRGQAIIEIAKKCSAEAIHPGYGFLSENADFAEACEQEQITFIGPPAAAMRLMGSKIAAKQLAQSINVPTIPGYAGDDQDDAILLNMAQRTGFPLLIKASAGGGGKGMRTVNTEADLLNELAGARREAQAAFGDATVFLERLLQQPRHIEIQILGDNYGQIIHLHERECSIQRRHQKIVEESPSVALTPALRAEMGEAAVRLAKAAGYTNAGTIEFMLDQDNHFYFLEMNTRLQVEHPVTEMITGLDLVRQQIMIAAGQHLELHQQDITTHGHAIEVRIYAEDPTRNFLPSTGNIDQFVPAAGPGIRVDSGVESGDEVTQYYDPMLAKLIVYGENRTAAIHRLHHALIQNVIFGVTTNIPLLKTISEHPAFAAGKTSTSFLTEYRLLHEALTDHHHTFIPLDVIIAAALSEVQNDVTPTNTQHTPWQTLGPWRIAGGERTLHYFSRNNSYQVALKPDNQQQHYWQFTINGETIGSFSGHPGVQHQWLIRQHAEQLCAFIHKHDGILQVALDGQIYQLQRSQPLSEAITAQNASVTKTQKTLAAPMAGTIVKIQVTEGETVAAHQVLVVLSAMKMEHSIIAPYDGCIKRIYYHEGDVVTGGANIIELE